MLKSPLPQSEEALRAVQEKLGPDRRPILIAVDGADGVGKSSFASWLTWQLGMPVVHLDLLLIKNCKPLCWRKKDLSCLVDARLAQGRPVIVEGILVLDALNNIGRHADFLIYIHGEGSNLLSTVVGDYISRRRPDATSQFTLKGFDVTD